MAIQSRSDKLEAVTGNGSMSSFNSAPIQSHSHKTSTVSNLARLIFCVAGIYICFLTWGILQERISTIAYPKGLESFLAPSGAIFPLNYFIKYYNLFFLTIHKLISSFVPSDDPGSANNEKFVSFIFLNACQAIFSWGVSSSVVFYYRRYANSSKITKEYRASTDQRGPSPIYVALKDVPIAPDKDAQFPSLDRKLFWLYLKISVIYSISSPFAYSSLKYIHYVAMNLGKACKLLPLVLIKIFVKRESIERGKLFNLLLITVGVIGFLLWEAPKANSPYLPLSSTSFSSILGYQSSIVTVGPFLLSMFGIFLLLVNLFLDGLMNTMQDEVFSTYKPSPFHMMFYLNRNSTILMINYLLFAPWSKELGNALRFISCRPSILPDILLFSFCGAVGQAIVFLTLGNFGAIFLVTITVTRKLFTILLSVLYFGHSLTLGQWISVMVVFVALILEAYMSSSRKSTHLPPVELSPTETGRYKVKKISNDVKKE